MTLSARSRIGLEFALDKQDDSDGPQKGTKVRVKAIDSASTQAFHSSFPNLEAQIELEGKLNWRTEEPDQILARHLFANDYFSSTRTDSSYESFRSI